MHKENEIEKFSAGYFLLKSYVDFCLKYFYKFQFIGKEKVKPNDTLIFVSNHQNALMDALVLLASFNWHPVILARSDIFKSKPVAKILTFFKMLPVYRIRDGFDQLANNQEVFKTVFGVLDRKNPLMLFPEGNHLGQKKIRALKKGVTRIALDYRHQSEEKKEIRIIPVGLNYSDYHKADSKLIISFGEPIHVSRFDTEYQENQAKANLALLNEIKNSLQNNALHIEIDEAYEVSNSLVDINDALSSENDATRLLQKQRDIIENIEEIYLSQREKYLQIESAVNTVNNLLKKEKLNISDLKLLPQSTCMQVIFTALSLVLTSPLFLYAFIQNLLPTWFLNFLLKKSKDPHFKSSISFVGTIFIFPVFHLLQAFLFGLITGLWLWAILYFLTLPLSLLILLSWKKSWVSLFKMNKLRKTKTLLTQALQSLAFSV